MTAIDNQMMKFGEMSSCFLHLLFSSRLFIAFDGEHILISWWTVMSCRGLLVHTSESWSRFFPEGGLAGRLAMTPHFRTTSHSHFKLWSQPVNLFRNWDEHVRMWAGHVDFDLSFYVLSILKVALDSFALEFWGWVVLYSIVLSSVMLFKRSFGLIRSLFILYVHEHNRPGFGMLTVETAVFPGCIWLHLLI